MIGLAILMFGECSRDVVGKSGVGLFLVASFQFVQISSARPRFTGFKIFQVRTRAGQRRAAARRPVGRAASATAAPPAASAAGSGAAAKEE
jgi:hypothetical protein